MSTSVHRKTANDVREDDRLLLKDLRVLTVQGRPALDVDGLIIRWHELATDQRGSMTVPRDQPVRVICPGYCQIEKELDSLI